MDLTLNRWRGRTALVTGASSGIGQAIAEALGRAGIRVALVARDSTKLEEVASRIRDNNGTAFVVVADLTQTEEITRAFAEVRDRFGGIDVLVNNAGISGGASLLEADAALQQSAIDLNLRAPLWCMREAVADMRRAGDGAIINISSLSAHRVVTGQSSVLYAATKHALRVVTDGLRFELAREKSTIKVAMISPGMVDTPFHEANRRGTPYAFAPLSTDAVVSAVLYILSTPPEVQISDILLRSSEQAF